jgi:hypothetical protein
MYLLNMSRFRGVEEGSSRLPCRSLHWCNPRIKSITTCRPYRLRWARLWPMPAMMCRCDDGINCARTWPPGQRNLPIVTAMQHQCWTQYLLGEGGLEDPAARPTSRFVWVMESLLSGGRCHGTQRSSDGDVRRQCRGLDRRASVPTRPHRPTRSSGAIHRSPCAPGNAGGLGQTKCC